MTQSKISLFLPTAEYKARPHADIQPSRVFPSMDIRYKNAFKAGATKGSNQDDDRNQEHSNADVILEKGGNDIDIDGVGGETLAGEDGDRVRVMRNKMGLSWAKLSSSWDLTLL